MPEFAQGVFDLFQGGLEQVVADLEQERCADLAGEDAVDIGEEAGRRLGLTAVRVQRVEGDLAVL